jgi:NAD(P)-dependent dehydrogenase (short-subunit alcohol dehydrogenase family)
MRLSGKVAIITGAGRGIGKAIAEAFAGEGAHISLAARTQRELESLAKEIRELGRQALVVPTDVTIEEQVKNLIDITLNTYGHIDVLVNNAGLGAYRPIYGTRETHWNNMLAVNLTSTFFGTKHIWKAMRKQGGGSIINVSSLSGTRAYPMYGAYSASKWGQIGFTKTAAEEGKPYNIRVNAIAPGKVDTAMRASVAENKDRMLKTQDCVGSAIFLASEDSRYVTGQVIEIEWFGPEA